MTNSKKTIYLFKKVKSHFIYINNHPQLELSLGLLLAPQLKDYENDVIKKHENTLLKRENLFKKYLDVCQFHAEPVLLSYDTQ